MNLELSGLRILRPLAFRRTVRRFVIPLACLALLPVDGCLGHHYVKTDFKAYETAFAETSNRELLLNLARLENRDPAYFFKMGQITSSYRMQGSLTTAGQLSAVTSPEGQVPTGGGSPGIIFENDPTFQYIPVNDDTNARLLMAPIQPETFYALYEQGWRMDQLFRLLVDRIETSVPDGNGGCSVETFRNTPPLGVRSADGRMRYDSVALSHYVTFLRVSALVYELQKSGVLVLRGTNTFVPYDPNAVLPLGSGKESPGDNAGTTGGNGHSNGVPLQPKDQNDAVARQDIWMPQFAPDNKTQTGWILGRKVFSGTFLLSPIQQKGGKFSSDPQTVWGEILPELQSNPDVSALIDPQVNLNDREMSSISAFVLPFMAEGFSLEGIPSPGKEQDICPSTLAAHIYMRSIIEVMAASSQEEKPFMDLMKENPMIPDDPENPRDRPVGSYDFRTIVPRIEQTPVLRLQWKDVHADALRPPLVSVVYHDASFKVTDEKSPLLAANATWNRDMFRLIEGLSSQVTVDISKFPLPEILQLHSD